MGNENEINKDLEVSRSQFLPEEVHDIDGQAMLYSLEDEFAKTKKNRNILLNLFIVLFIGAVVAGTILLTNYISEQSKNVDININEFQDLRLRELIDTAKKNESEVDVARRELEDLKFKKQNAVLDLKDEFNMKKENVYSQPLPDEDIAAKVAAIDKAEQRKVSHKAAWYDKRIAAKKREIAAIEKSMSTSDKSYKDGIKKSGAILTNYDRLYSIKAKAMQKTHKRELASQKRYYERYIKSLKLKYNPFFRSKRIKEVLQSKVDPASSKKVTELQKYNPLLSKEGIYSEAEFGILRMKIGSHDVLMRRLMRVPYMNSVPPSLSRISFLSRSIIYDYEAMWIGLTATVDNKNKTIRNYRYAFDTILKVRPESGYIIDPRKKSSIIIHINKLHNITEGRTALVFRHDDEFIGKIQFIKSRGEMRAKQIESAPGDGTGMKKRIQAFDKILLEMNQEKL
ncbi:MAG: hypothetical protein GY754_02675 [bacterium]|nr:hypothetical protein [bacterium]